MKPISKDDNFYFLFFALLILFFGCAVMQQFFPEGQKTVLGLIIVTLAASIAGINRGKAIYRSWYGVLLVTASVSGIFSFFEDYDLSIVTLSALLAFLLSHIYSALKQVMQTKTVTTNHIIGSLCIYLLLGLAWATLYLLILEVFPVAFTGLEAKPWLTNLFNALYFSFITLTTVGYGDISPTVPVAQFFVFLESIIGSFYLAIMVASLVSIRLTQMQEKV
ncbi:two pore domain potassium channel family protein [Vibrio sp. SCSIO 43135]|uniref:potassium channel family protein n=1 Tax=Vibrio sp. SCSIO 43135 TaxID=2819096 RepID=UPI0020750D4A|nr:ion channel [Vibrio sp. SCSIO 43135]USD43934.1 two pore domain potassium channel family protein [Vibrio sp. SCSIO 43135]